MAALYEIWRQAEVSRRLDVLSGFVAMCVAADDDAKRRLASLVADANAALSQARPDLEAASECLTELVRWADTQWADHPYRPTEARPDEADRQTRDYAKDLLRDRLPVGGRGELLRVELHLEVRFLALTRDPRLDPRAREDVFYVAGRAAMALDLGHWDVAEQEILRMERVGFVAD
jgi:hypothetical protein